MRSLLGLLLNKINITRVPFSSRGSRILVYQYPDQDYLNIHLTERLTEFYPGLESYIQREPYIHRIFLVDENCKPLSFKTTTKPHILEFQTRLGRVGLLFQDQYTLCFSFPPNKQVGIRLVMAGKNGGKKEHGGEIHADRNLAYMTNAKIILNNIFAKKGLVELDFLIQNEENNTLLLCIHENPTEICKLKPFPEVSQEVELQWQRWFEQAPAVKEKYQSTYAYAWWVLANNLIEPKGNIAFEVDVPSKKSYVGIWLWDNAMHAIALRHIDPELARNQIRAILIHQLSDGMLPDAIFDEGIVTEIDHPFYGKVTKPPILAWSALKIHNVAPDLDFLEEIYEPLVRWNTWWLRENDDDRDGIIQYNHPFSSGLDDSPLWDYGMPVESPDINTYLFTQMKSLALMADLLNKKNDAAAWEDRANRIVYRMVEDMWDAEHGIFQCLYKEKPIPVLTPVNLLPLWIYTLPSAIHDRLIEHLTNPTEFWGDIIIPTVARNDPQFNPDQMWRGPIWANINYFFIEALQLIGESDLAKQLCSKTLDLIMKNTGIHEYYNADTGKPGQKAAPIFGWTAAVFIDLAIQASSEK